MAVVGLVRPRKACDGSERRAAANPLRAAMVCLLVGLLAVTGVAMSRPGSEAFLGTMANAGVGTIVPGGNATNVVYLVDASGNRTGIKQFEYDGVTFYDIYGGAAKPANRSNTQFFKDALVNAPEGGVSPLDNWSKIAYSIFREHSDYAAAPLSSDTFDGDFGQNLIHYLKRTSSGRDGEPKDANTSWTGLTSARSLADTRLAMARSVVEGVGRNNVKSNPEWLLKNLDSRGDDQTLALLNDPTDREVFHSVVSAVRKKSLYEYYFSSFGIAFYDFTLSPVVPDGLDLVTAAEGHESVASAASSGAPGVSFNEVQATNPVISKAENRTDRKIVDTVSYTTGQIQTVSNTVSTSQTFTFEETIGFGMNFTSVPPAVSGGFWGEIKLGQAFDWSEARTVQTTESTTHTHTVSVDVPAHTIAIAETSDGIVEITLDYTAPVRVSFKVAIFAMGGTMYADGAATKSLSTASYHNRHFATLFGTLTGDASGDLATRVSHSNDSGWEKVQQVTFGRRHQRSYSPVELTAVNWNQVLAAAGPRYTFWDPYPLKLTTVEHFESGRAVADTLTSTAPFSGFGHQLTTRTVSKNATVHPPVPLYPLAKVRFADGAHVRRFEMATNATLEFFDAAPGLVALNAQGVPFYGFDEQGGQWVVAEGGELATITRHPVTGHPIITSLGAPGVVTLSYRIEEGRYGHHGATTLATNASLNETAHVQITITAPASDAPGSLPAPEPTADPEQTPAPQLTPAPEFLDTPQLTPPPPSENLEVSD